MHEIIGNITETWQFIVEYRRIIVGIGLLLSGVTNTMYANNMFDDAYNSRGESYNDPIEQAILMLGSRVWSLGWSFIAVVGVVLIVI